MESAQGHGTCVTIYLPKTFDESDSARILDMPEETRFTGRVLLVEDNRDVSVVTRGCSKTFVSWLILSQTPRVRHAICRPRTMSTDSYCRIS